MTAPRPEIQRYQPVLDPFLRDDGSFVLYSDHLRAVTLAKIEVLEEIQREPDLRHAIVRGECCLCHIETKIAALRKELGDE